MFHIYIYSYLFELQKVGELVGWGNLSLSLAQHVRSLYSGCDSRVGKGPDYLITALLWQVFIYLFIIFFIF